MVAVAPYREWRGALSVVTATRPEGMAWSCLRRKSGWGSGKEPSPEGDQALARDPQGTGHGPRLTEFKEDSALGHKVFVDLCRARSWT